MQDFAFPTSEWHPHEGVNHVKNFSGIYNQLIEYDSETDDPFDIKSDLAKSWELAKDGMTYTFRLDENAKWHDGKPVTAEDVVFSLDSLVDKKAKRPQTLLLAAYYAQGNSRAIDPHTVEVKTIAPAAEFIPVLATDLFKIIAKHWVASGIDTKKWENGMGSGPFKPGKLIKDVSIELVKNPNYWKPGLPYIDGMKHFTIVDHGTIIAAYKTEQVLMTNFPVTNLSNAEGLQLQKDMEGKLKMYFIPNSSVIGTLINTRVKPFDDVRVRRALHLGIDRSAFRAIFGGGIAPIGAPFPPGSWFGRTEEEIARLPGFRLTADGKKHPDDLAEARRLLAEAGVPKGFKVDIMARQVVEFVDVAQLLADQWRQYLNIDATVKPVDSATGFNRYDKGDYVLAAQGTAFLVPEPDSIIGKMFMPGGLWIQWSGWQAPPKFIEQFNQQSREPDQPKRAAVLRQMEDYMLNEDPGPLLAYYWSFRDWAVNNRIKNFHMPPALFAQIKHERIWCDPKC